MPATQLAERQGLLSYPRVSGNWYHLIDGVTAVSGQAIQINLVKLIAFELTKSITIQTLGARVNSNVAASNMQLALYATNYTTGRPTGNALANTASISGAVVGLVSANPVGGNFTLSAGIYWMAVNADTAGVIYQVAQPTTAINLIGEATQSSISSATTVVAYALEVSQTFGTWPDLTNASFTVRTGSSNGQFTVPLIHARAA